MTFVLLAFATFLTWTTLSSLIPFRIPTRLQPFVVVGLAYGLTFLPAIWLLVVAAVGAVALLHTIIGDAPDPWDWTRLKNLVPKNVSGKRERKPAPGVGMRIPTLD